MANISSDAVQSLLNYLEILGLERNQCLTQLELTEAQLCQKRLVNINKYLSLYVWAESKLNIPHLGFDYGRVIDVSRWGVLGQLVYSSSTLGQAITSQTQYQSISGSLGTPSYTLDKGVLTLIWTPADSYNHHLSEELITSWVAFARKVTATNITPIRVWFSHNKQDNLLKYNQYFNCPVEFNKSSSGITVDAKILSKPILTANNDLNKVLKQYANKLLSEFSVKNPVAVATDFLKSQLPQNTPTIADLAKFLSTSERTIQRRLSEFDTSYSQLLDDTRKMIALNYLLNTQMPIEKASEMLGFSEQSAFTRAFKRWTGQAPAQFRLEHQKFTF